MEEKTLREICEETGVTRRAVQGYEKAGLISASGRNKYGYLLYSPETEEQISQIRFLQEIGFAVKEIKSFENAPREEQKEELEKKAQELQAQCERMEILLARLDEMIRKL